MIDKIIGEECTGCTACFNVCLKNAIQMRWNMEGFQYPAVNYDQCISCGLCIKVCPVLNNVSVNLYDTPDTYAAWNKDVKTRIGSTSGGVFSALAENVISRGGSVVGAVYDNRFRVEHIIIDKSSDIVKLSQSKYTQSNLTNIFSRIKKRLDDGKIVLFCGTPCQSAGLQSYLRKPYANLYCCDFICRGVTSPAVYQKYLSDISKEHQGQLVKVHFKNKDYGWNRFSTKLYFSDGSVYQEDRYHDSYLLGYLRYNLYLRPCCHQCHFKTMPRVSDLSLGDFWGIGNFNADLDDDLGTSVILVNSERGKQLMSWISEDLVIERRSLNEVIAGNDCLLHSAPIGEFREYFFQQIDKMPFEKLIYIIAEKSLHLTARERIKRILHLYKLRLKGLF